MSYGCSGCGCCSTRKNKMIVTYTLEHSSVPVTPNPSQTCKIFRSPMSANQSLECKLYGDGLVVDGTITQKDIREFRSGKAGRSIISIGLPAYCILQALLRSAKANIDGLLLSDNTEIMTKNRPKDAFFDYFFDPLLIIKEQIRIENFIEEEEDYLCKLQGITKAISRYPTVRRRFDELLESFSKELETKMEGVKALMEFHMVEVLKEHSARNLLIIKQPRKELMKWFSK
ncbi:hypothetical protein HPP92_008262 [Vanilla planifolia]|uniref:Uncharacterized protein n=1 Tax=Vanilla planifolia TaxID=51239 RepID=A0A835R5S9_VANPL|nr:hypothetical protein HPP92_008262 [Vanilla planifolia]